jgi:hypothetical protein
MFEQLRHRPGAQTPQLADALAAELHVTFGEEAG